MSIDIFTTAILGIVGAGGGRLDIPDIAWNVDDQGRVRGDVAPFTPSSSGVGTAFQNFVAGATRRLLPALEDGLSHFIATGEITDPAVARIVAQNRQWQDARADFAASGGADFEEDRDATVRGGDQVTPVGPEDFFVPQFVRRFHTSIPGGAAGFAQQTPVGQEQMLGRSVGRGLRRVRKGSSSRRRLMVRTRAGRRLVRGKKLFASNVVKRREPHRGRRKLRAAHLVKGSAAAKRHMAKLRRMQKGSRRR